MKKFKIHEKTATKSRKLLSIIAKPLLKLSGFRITGSFPNNKRVILIAIPHTSFYDMYLMFLMVFTLGIDMNFLAAKWIFSRIASPFRLYTDPDKQGIPWPLGFIQKYIFIKAGGIPVVRSGKMTQLIFIISILKRKDSFNLIIAPEGGITNTNVLRLGFILLGKKLNADVVPVQVDYQNKVFNLLEPLDISQQKDELITELMMKFDGVVGKKSTYRFNE